MHRTKLSDSPIRPARTDMKHRFVAYARNMTRYMPLQWLVIAFIAGLILLAGLLGHFYESRTMVITTASGEVFDWEQIMADTPLTFAGETVPLDARHPTIREKLTREFAITRFTVYQFSLYHKRAPLYLPAIVAKLKTAGIPEDFQYLAIAESGLRNSAVSDKNAGGIWQFIPDTAKRFGMRVDDRIDERYDFDTSTDAAIKYFQYLYGRFHNWTLVAAAYNRGEGGIDRALLDEKTDSYYDLFLNEETGRYIYRILAIKYLMEHRQEVFSPWELGEAFIPANTVTVSVSGGTILSDWVKDKGYSYGTVRELNTWILTDTLPTGNDWKITVPR